jgi:hypothetical protein
VEHSFIKTLVLNGSGQHPENLSMSAAAVISPLFIGGLDACRYWKLGIPGVVPLPYWEVL